MKSSEWRLPSVFEIVQFVGVVAVYFVFGAVAFYRVLGVVGAAHGLAMVWSRTIPVGIEGRAPSFHVTGASAIVAGLLVAAAGLALAWFAPEAVCYFSEGRECP
jgi:hypothetical protein